MDLLHVVLALRDQLLGDLLLLSNHRTELGVDDARMQLAVHEGGADVVFDVACVYGPCNFYIFGETLLFKIANGEFVGVGKKVLNATLSTVVLDVVHHVGAVAFNLFVAGDGAEDNLCEALAGKGSKTNATDRRAIFDKGKGFVFAVDKGLNSFIQTLSRIFCFQFKLNMRPRLTNPANNTY